MARVYGVFVSFLLFFFLALNSVHAQTISAEEFLDLTFDEGGNLPPGSQAPLSAASAQFAQLPDPVKAIFGNQTIALDLVREDGVVEHLGITLKGNVVQSVTRYAPRNPTMKVETDEATVQRVALSEDKTSALLQAINSKDLTYKGLNSTGEAAVIAADVFSWITLVVKAFLHFFGIN